MSAKIEDLINPGGDVIKILKESAHANPNKILKEYPFPVRRYSKGKWRIIFIICAEVSGVKHPFVENIYGLCESEKTVVILFVLPRNEKLYKKALEWIKTP